MYFYKKRLVESLPQLGRGEGNGNVNIRFFDVSLQKITSPIIYLSP